MPLRLRYVPLAMLLVAVVEIVVFVLLGRAVGFGLALLLVLVASVAGLFLLRREGMRAWRGFRDAAQAGQPPGRQVTEGLVGLFAGLLLAMPGLVSGLVGVLLVVPPVRRAARVLVQRGAERRVSSMMAGQMFGPRRVRVYPGAPSSAPPGSGPTTAAGPTSTSGPAGPLAPGGGAGPDGRPSGGVVEGEIVDR
ncbi:FxsA family protein [Plantactinospora sp. GCM10030261]|uniref:FxsA family protein n=1 Tax=Plantactinospora sp. GCM10030261 TaxID=3273420 RepID=UPI003608B169